MLRRCLKENIQWLCDCVTVLWTLLVGFYCNLLSQMRTAVLHWECTNLFLYRLHTGLWHCACLAQKYTAESSSVSPDIFRYTMLFELSLVISIPPSKLLAVLSLSITPNTTYPHQCFSRFLSDPVHVVASESKSWSSTGKTQSFSRLYHRYRRNGLQILTFHSYWKIK